jgi:hypothetical protein
MSFPPLVRVLAKTGDLSRMSERDDLAHCTRNACFVNAAVSVFPKVSEPFPSAVEVREEMQNRFIAKEHDHVGLCFIDLVHDLPTSFIISERSRNEGQVYLWQTHRSTPRLILTPDSGKLRAV